MSYIGKWYDNHSEEKNTDAMIECVRVEGSNAVFSDGKRIPLQELDFGDRYERIAPAYQSPEIQADLGSQFGNGKKLSEQAAQSEILGNLSKIGTRSNNKTVNETRIHENEQVVHETNNRQPVGVTAPSYEVTTISDPVATFIDAAIMISRKAGKVTSLPVTIDLKLDFDVIDVITTTSKMGATDIEILQHILKHIHITVEDIKKLIGEALTSNGEDAEIVNDDRESQFNETLKEELSNEHDEYEEL